MTATARSHRPAMSRPRVTVCIPHWESRVLAVPCLRSLRAHATPHAELEVLVVDNGSRDGSLDYLRSLPWVRLVERPRESPANWPRNVFTAWDLAAEIGTGEFLVTMHADVFVRRADWLAPFLREMARGPHVAAAGSWKLQVDHPLYALEKRITGTVERAVKRLLGRRPRVHGGPPYPRDYCAMYRRTTLLEHGVSFVPDDRRGGGVHAAERLWAAGFETAVFPVAEMAERVAHVAHGTAAAGHGKPLNHADAQRKAERNLAALLAEPWVRALVEDESLDGVAEPVAVAA